MFLPETDWNQYADILFINVSIFENLEQRTKYLIR